MMLEEMKDAYARKVSPFKMESALKIARTLGYRMLETVEQQKFDDGLAMFEKDNIYCYVMVDLKQACVRLMSYSNEGPHWSEAIKDKRLKEETKYITALGEDYGFDILEIGYSLEKKSEAMKVYIKFSEDADPDALLSKVADKITERLSEKEGVIIINIPSNFDSNDTGLKDS